VARFSAPLFGRRPTPHPKGALLTKGPRTRRAPCLRLCLFLRVLRVFSSFVPFVKVLLRLRLRLRFRLRLRLGLRLRLRLGLRLRLRFRFRLRLGLRHRLRLGLRHRLPTPTPTPTPTRRTNSASASASASASSLSLPLSRLFLRALRVFSSFVPFVSSLLRHRHREPIPRTTDGIVSPASGARRYTVRLELRRGV
jgi:hypothetical protein